MITRTVKLFSLIKPDYLFFRIGILVFFFLAVIESKASVEAKKDTIEIYLQNQIKQALDSCNQNPELALIWSSKALEIASENNFEKQKAELNRIIGLVWFYKADYVKSLDYFMKSQALFHQIQDKAGEASALNNISLVYRNQGYVEKALEMDKQVLAMRLIIGDSVRIAGSYNNLAVAYRDMKDYSLAMANYQNAVAISLKLGNTGGLDLYYNNIGNLYFDQNKPDSAFYYFKKSLSISEPLNHKQMMANAYTYLGEYYFHLDSINLALVYLQKGLKIFQEIGIIYEIEWAAENLYQAYEKKGDFKNAFTMHLLFKQMADSAKNSETIQTITRIESELKFDQYRN